MLPGDRQTEFNNVPTISFLRKSAFRLMCFGLAGGLSACTLLQKQDAPACPNVLIPEDSAQLVVFKQGSGRDLTDILVQAEFEGFLGSCTYDTDNQAVEVRLSPFVLVSRGPASDGSAFGLEYFVALAAPDGEILNKQVFDARFTLPDGLMRGRVRDEEIELTARLPDLFQGPDYTVYMGFQLTREQLDYNRQSTN